jgi:excisionase family DNA binding protein
MRNDLAQGLQNLGAMTVDEFCGWARIGRSKFYQEVQEGRIRLRKIGRKSVVIRTDAEAWLCSLPATA